MIDVLSLLVQEIGEEAQQLDPSTFEVDQPWYNEIPATILGIPLAVLAIILVRAIASAWDGRAQKQPQPVSGQPTVGPAGGREPSGHAGEQATVTGPGDTRTQVAAALAGIVAQFGTDRLDSRERVSSMLADRLGSSGTAVRKEIRLVAAAAGEGVVGQLSAGEPAAAVARRFAAATDFTDEASTWAVNAWAAAIHGAASGR